MSIISKNVSKVKVLSVGLVMMLAMFATSAYALEAKSTAKLDLTTEAKGGNVNIWKGSTKMSTNITFMGTSSLGGPGVVTAYVMKEVPILPDAKAYSKNIYSTGSDSTTVSIPEKSSYYAKAIAAGISSGTVTITENQ